MIEAVRVTCPGCQSVVTLSPDWLDQPLRCKRCHMVFQTRAANGEAGSPLAVSDVQPALSGIPTAPGEARRPRYELLIAFVVILGVTAWYVALAQDGVPRASSLVGHVLAILGFLLMLSTETLYTLRKRLPRFTLGRMSTWLLVHIFTGIVGPYLVILHSGWSFHGLAGVLTLLVGVMVVSGFVGRYIYTAVPRTLEGVEVQVFDLEEKIADVDAKLQALGVDRAETAAMTATMHPARGFFLVLGRPIVRWRQRRRLKRLVQKLVPKLKPAPRAAAAELYGLLKERQALQLQINSLDATRQLLARWHLFHVPLSGALFTLAGIHIAAALYYATYWK